MVVRVIPFLLALGSSTFAVTAAATDSESDLLQEIILNQMIFTNPEHPGTVDRSSLISILDSTLIPEQDITFHLYTKSNPDTSYILKVGDIANLNDSNFDADLSTKIVIHGWTDSVNSYWFNNFRRNYLTVGEYNVIGVDWFPGAVKEYFTSTKITRKVGEYLADLLRFLESDTNLDLNNVHLLGHSLGSHIAGFAGAILEGRIGRITGLDPARPAFEIPNLKDVKDRLDFSDAKFVDIIHSCAGTVGFTRPIGHVDFYPNGGSFRQPGCSILLSQYCSHARAHQFMAEAIIYPEDFVAVQCDSWKDYKTGNCSRGQITLLGEKVDRDARGTFYLETNAASPFGRGLFGKQSNKLLHV